MYAVKNKYFHCKDQIFFYQIFDPGLVFGLLQAENFLSRYWNHLWTWRSGSLTPASSWTSELNRNKRTQWVAPLLFSFCSQRVRWHVLAEPCYLLTLKKRACGISNMIQKRKAVQKPIYQPLHVTAWTFDPCRAETSSTSVCNHQHGPPKSTTTATAKLLFFLKRRKKMSGPPPPPPPQQHVPTWLIVDSQNILDTLSQTKGEGE